MQYFVTSTAREGYSIRPVCLFVCLSVSPADKKNYCDRVDQSMELGMQVWFGIYNSIRRGAKNFFN